MPVVRQMVSSVFWLGVTLCLVSAIVSVVSWRYFRRAVLDFQDAHDLREQVTEALERVTSAESSLRRLHSRAGMRENRERKGTGLGDDERPDPGKQPDAWLRWAQKQRVVK